MQKFSQFDCCETVHTCAGIQKSKMTICSGTHPITRGVAGGVAPAAAPAAIARAAPAKPVPATVRRVLALPALAGAFFAAAAAASMNLSREPAL